MNSRITLYFEPNKTYADELAHKQTNRHTDTHTPTLTKTPKKKKVLYFMAGGARYHVDPSAS